MTTAGHLFAGIDGFGLGLAAAGVRTVWTVELDPFCDEVLALRLPDVERMRDVREVKGPPAVPFITAGFPCQDLSHAGLRGGITGARSGLYAELVRVVADVEPELVLIENVPALLHRGMELLVRDLVALGYGVEWDCLPAAAFGAPHLRDRVWIVAHRHGAPRVFGQPAALFPLPPGEAAELVGGGDDDDAPTTWLRWPRAGWVDADPDLVLALQPLAPLSDVKRGLSGFDPWPTPVASLKNYDEDPAQFLARKARNAEKDDDATRAGIPLGIAVRLGDNAPRNYPPPRMPTPTASMHKGPGPLDRRPRSDDNLPTRIARETWPTPTRAGGLRGPDAGGATRERKPNGGPPQDLLTAVTRTMLPTPRASDGDRRNRGDLIAHAKDRANRHHPGPRPEGRETERRSGGLNPVWVEWLMGFPLGWTDLDVANDDLVARSWEDGDADLDRITARTPRRRERLSALGNALVPQAPAWIAQRALDLLEAAA